MPSTTAGQHADEVHRPDTDAAQGHAHSHQVAQADAAVPRLHAAGRREGHEGPDDGKEEGQGHQAQVELCADWGVHESCQWFLKKTCRFKE